MKTLEDIKPFAALLEREQLTALVESQCNCEANRENAKTRIKMGRKYANVDIGTSGRYMVVLETGEIFSCKAYGVIHRGHAFGTLDTIHDWDWRGYHAQPITRELRSMPVN